MLKNLPMIGRFCVSRKYTFRPAYCKRLALRNRFQLTEAEFDDDLFVFGQFHTLDEADQKFSAGESRIQKLLHQFSCSIFGADRAFFLCFQFLQLFFQRSSLHLHSLIDALEVSFGKQSGQSVHIHLIQVGSQTVNLTLILST